MHPQQLIGKKALRTKPTIQGDYSFTSRNPVVILACTESHIVIEHTGGDKEMMLSHKGDAKSVLNCAYIDDNWTSYDDLMNLANDKHIQLMQDLMKE